MRDIVVTEPGELPMRYLARWRLRLAAHRQRSSDMPLARLPSKWVTSREPPSTEAFKRSFGDRQPRGGTGPQPMWGACPPVDAMIVT